MSVVRNDVTKVVEAAKPAVIQTVSNTSSPEAKVAQLKIALHDKLFKQYTQEQVNVAVDVAVATLPRVKNYFTKLEKSFKLLTNKTALVVKLTKYSLEHPEVSYSSLAYSLKEAAGQKVIKDDILSALLDAGTFEIRVAKGGSREAKEYDFNI